jgi:RHS repeat-associated protein
MARFAVGLSLIRSLLRISFLSLLCPLLCVPSFAQQYPNSGFPLFSTQIGGQYDLIDLADSNISLSLPVRNMQSGPMPLSFSLFGASNAYLWNSPFTGTTWAITTPSFSFLQNVGATLTAYSSVPTTCNGVADTVYTNISVTDANGTVHPLNPNIIQDSGGCNPLPSPPAQPTIDGSGYTYVFTGFSLKGTLYDKSGNTYSSSYTISGGTQTYVYTVKTSDGVTGQKTTTSQGTGCTGGWCTTVTDALTSTPVISYQTPATAGGPISYAYTNAQGNVINPPYTVTFTAYTQVTNFGCYGITEYGPFKNQYLPTSITTPTGGKYTISYETTPNYSSTTYPPPYTTGRIASITLPSGGSISYTYQGGNNGINCTSGVIPTLIRTVNDNSGNVGKWTYVNSNSSLWSNSYNSNFTVAVTDPAGNQTAYNFQGQFQTQVSSYQGGCPTSITGCNGGGTLLKATTTCYNGIFTNCAQPTAGSIAGPPFSNFSQTDVYTSYNGGPSNLIEMRFDIYGKATEVKQYDFGAAMPPTGNPLSDTLTYYGQSWNGSSCAAYPSGVYIYTTPCYSYTKNSAGTTVAQTQITYSNTGHPTSTSRWVSGSTWLPAVGTVTASYNGNGTVAWTKDAAGNQTSYGYAATSSGGCNSLLLTSTTYPVTAVGSDSQAWDCNGGVLTSYEDVNGNTTTYSYTANGADPLYRLKEVIPPIESPTTYTYHTGSLPWYAATTQLVWGSYYAYHQVNLDGLGRAVATTDSDPNSPVNYRYAITTYNSVGQVASVTNPYFCDGTNCSPADATYGFTTYNYDALGRVADVGSTPAVTLPDGNTNHIVYTNRAKLVTDGAGIQRASQSDGLGRLQYVCDGIGAVAQANNASPSTCSGVDGSPSGFLATYGYDALNNLTSASVGAHSGYSGQTRSFTYDGLSRMLTSTNPESGTVTNVYDTGSAGDLFTTTLPKPNASSGTVTACYGSWSGSSCTSSGWDAMHRLTYVSFSDGSNPIGYAYDSNNVWGTPVNNPKGRMVLANHATQGAALFSYDTGGRLINTWQCTPINCGSSSYPLSYTYNYVNQPQATTDAAGNTFSKAYNAAGEVTSVQSSKTGTNYPQYLLTNISYNALGEVVSATYGDGIVRTNTYDKMGRPTEIQDGTTSSPTYRLYLTYYGNGNVKTFNDTVSGYYYFTYDAFNRLVSSTNTAQSYSWTYDQFGNRWHQDKTAGSGYTVDLSFNNSNRITTGGFSYDAAGNLLKDGSGCNPCWGYDAAGNLVSSSYGSSAASYSYDALGRRVEKVSGGTTYDFVLDGSNPLDEYQGSVWPTVWSRTNGGVFTYANGTTYFNRSDNIGTPRVSTDYTGAVKRTETMGPFGDGFTESYAGLDFTGFAAGVWDQENNGDHFGAREYAKTQGRWLTPDPAGLAAVDPSNPQTWNRYAYVTNNPVSLSDPSGLGPDDNNSPCVNGSGASDCNSGGEPSMPNFGLQPTDGPYGVLKVPYPPPDAAFLTAINSQLFWDVAQSFPSFPQPPNQKTCKTGFGFGFTVSGDAGAGLGYGAGGNAGAGAGVFMGNGLNTGAFASGGAGASAFGHGTSAPSGNLIGRFFGGAAAGAGGGLFVTNASQASQLGGLSGTWNVDLGYFVNGSAQFSAGKDAAGNSIWSFSFTLGGGFGALYHQITSKTVTAGRKGGC